MIPGGLMMAFALFWGASAIGGGDPDSLVRKKPLVGEQRIVSVSSLGTIDDEVQAASLVRAKSVEGQGRADWGGLSTAISDRMSQVLHAVQGEDKSDSHAASKQEDKKLAEEVEGKQEKKKVESRAASKQEDKKLVEEVEGKQEQKKVESEKEEKKEGEKLVPNDSTDKEKDNTILSESKKKDEMVESNKEVKETASQIQRVKDPDPQGDNVADAVPQDQAAMPSWSYTDPNGWANTWPECEGQQQSPINLVSGVITSDGTDSMPFNYHVVNNTQLINSGKTLQVIADFGTLTMPDGIYNAKELHFHFPSEHYLDGVHHPGELDILHQKVGSNGTDDLLMVAVFLEENTNTDLSFLEEFELEDALPTAGNSEPIASIDLNDLGDGPFQSDFYHYMGSLTVPPCEEGVKWYVMGSPAGMKHQMFLNFKARFPDPMNNRPIMPLYGRNITRNSLHMPTTTSTTTTTTPEPYHDTTIWTTILTSPWQSPPW